jgi:beta-galactosidase
MVKVMIMQTCRYLIIGFLISLLDAFATNSALFRVQREGHVRGLLKERAYSLSNRPVNLGVLRGGSETTSVRQEDFTKSSGWQRSIGVCYYPEHWDKDLWEKDAAAMADLGITYVRIGEFMWSTIQPSPPPADYDWSVLDDSLEILGRHGLKVILGTPTACPPKWLIDAHPDVLPFDARETPRKFGSRRHYSFSSDTFRKHTVAVCTAMANRYGKHPAVVGWQLDNEYGCHDTVRTYDPNARLAFRKWLSVRYGGDISALNTAWGGKFWSAEYRSFDEVDLPCNTVTEAGPSHRLDFYRFSSDQVRRLPPWSLGRALTRGVQVLSYNALQAEAVAAASPGRSITHNLMMLFFDFDAWALSSQVPPPYPARPP